MNKERVIITGASSGLGQSVAYELIRGGAELALVGRNLPALEEVAGHVPSHRQNQRVIAADLADPGQLDGLVKRCHEAFGDNKPFKHLIYCAGYGVTGPVESIPREAFEECWQVNFHSAVSMVQQCLPEMKAARAGMITLVGSGVAWRALPYNSPYCTAKAALHSFSESLRVEVPHPITVLHFSPGPVASNFHAAVKHFGDKGKIEVNADGQLPREVGVRLVDALVAREERVVLGAKASLAVHLNYWTPKLLDRLMARLFKAA